MPKSILNRVVIEAVELGKDVVRKGIEEAETMVKEGIQVAVGASDRHQEIAEKRQQDQKTKAIGIPHERRIIEMAKGQRGVQEQMVQEAKIREQQQRHAQRPAKQELAPAALPASVSHQPHIQGLGRKKATTALAAPASIETKHAGRD